MGAQLSYPQLFQDQPENQMYLLDLWRGQRMLRNRRLTPVASFNGRMTRPVPKHFGVTAQHAIATDLGNSEAKALRPPSLALNREHSSPGSSVSSG